MAGGSSGIAHWWGSVLIRQPEFLRLLFWAVLCLPQVSSTHVDSVMAEET